jgi:hypothetical protein
VGFVPLTVSDDDKQPGALTVSAVLARRNMMTEINDETWRPNSIKEALAELGRSDDRFALFVTHLTHLPLKFRWKARSLMDVQDSSWPAT